MLPIRRDKEQSSQIEVALNCGQSLQVALLLLVVNVLVEVAARRTWPRIIVCVRKQVASVSFAQLVQRVLAPLAILVTLLAEFIRTCRG